MKVLVHYTTRRVIYDLYNKDGIIDDVNDDIQENIIEFYNKYNRNQSHLFFLVSYYNIKTCETKFTLCNIGYDVPNQVIMYVSIDTSICSILLNDLGITSYNAYESDIYFKTFTIDEKDSFINVNRDIELNKIKLKYFKWDELITNKEILFEEICNKIFDIDNVLKVASTYKPSVKLTDNQRKKKYFDALKSIGFISKEGININHTTLHGDIGEFLMHIMLVKHFSVDSNEKYIYPKLVLKSSPKMPVYGNDGTIYIKDKNEIYFLEAKFYEEFEDAINSAVKSLTAHNEVSTESYSHRVDLFRNIKTDELYEIIEIDEDVSENLIMFLICENYMNYDDILNAARLNQKLTDLKSNFRVLLFVLPILNKIEYLNYFFSRSSEVWEGFHDK